MKWRIIGLILILPLIFLLSQVINQWRAEALFPSSPSALRQNLEKYPPLPEQILRLERCIALQPANAEYRLLLAERLLLKSSLPGQSPESRQKDVEQAGSHILAARRAKPIDPRGPILLGQYLLERGRTEEALSSFRQAISLAPHKGQVHAYLAMALTRALREIPDRPQREAMIQEARITFRRAAELDPSLLRNLSFLSSLADLHLAAGERDLALRYLQQVAALPYQREALPCLLRLASLYLQKGETARAVGIYRALLTRPDLAWQRTSLEQEMHRASIFYPQASELHQLLGELHFDKGDWPTAATHYQRWALLQPSSPEAHFHLGLAYERLGKGELALAQYENTLRLDRGHRGATQKILQHYRRPRQIQ